MEFIKNSDLTNSAQEVIDRFGGQSIAYVEERITRISIGGAIQELDQAYRLLNEVERLIVEGN